jgi:DNA-binding ferritin-like protein
MDSIATQLFCLRLFAHRAHNDVQGETFFSDHKAFGKLYEAYDGEYDSVVERIIGLGGKPDLAKLNETGARKAAVHPNEHDPKKLFAILLSGEIALCGLCCAELGKASEGTKNLLAQICDNSEQRQFLMKKRLA